jgi:ATP synthase F1 delta subunit
MELKTAMVYGRALYALAEETGRTEDFRQELTAIREIFDNEDAFRTVLASPGVVKAEKKQILKAVFEGRVSTDILSFLCILIDKHRVHYLDRIVSEYIRIDDEEHRIGEGVIYSVVPLTDEQISSFEARAGALLQKKVSLENVIDKSLIGGVKLFVDDKLIDASLSTELGKLGRQIKYNL